MEKDKIADTNIKKGFIILTLFTFFIIILLNSSLSLENETSASLNQNQDSKEVYFFWGNGCPHCENVINSRVLEEVEISQNISIKKLEVYNNQFNRDLYLNFSKILKIPQQDQGVPLLIIECNDSYSYLSGDKDIIENLRKSPLSCNYKNNNPLDNPNNQNLKLSAIIIPALIDSINPCAFGVLIFLISTIFSTASSKRVLKYGLVYIFVVFLVYFSIGFGIINLFSELSPITKYIVTITGALVFFGGIIEIKDFFYYGKGISLKIPNRIKPSLERVTKKGTIFSVILLGCLVTLVELPCTGGIYLAILSWIHINKVSGTFYLLVYNIIFVLPLLIILLIAYSGIKTDRIQNWIDKNKKIMRLISGVIMIVLSLYLLNSFYHWI